MCIFVSISTTVHELIAPISFAKQVVPFIGRAVRLLSSCEISPCTHRTPPILSWGQPLGEPAASYFTGFKQFCCLGLLLASLQTLPSPAKAPHRVVLARWTARQTSLQGKDPAPQARPGPGNALGQGFSYSERPMRSHTPHARAVWVRGFQPAPLRRPAPSFTALLPVAPARLLHALDRANEEQASEKGVSKLCPGPSLPRLPAVDQLPATQLLTSYRGTLTGSSPQQDTRGFTLPCLPPLPGKLQASEWLQSHG